MLKFGKCFALFRGRFEFKKIFLAALFGVCAFSCFADEVKQNKNRTDLNGAYYKNPVAYVEKEFASTKNWERALEISLYYMGWPAEDVFYKFKWERQDDDFNDTPSDDMMRMAPKIRDAKLAFIWAKIASETYDETANNFHASGSPWYNLDYMYLEGIGIEKNFEVFKKSYRFFRAWRFEPPPFGRKEFGGIFAYMYYKGDGGFPQDLSKCDEIIQRGFPKDAWKNFYCGFMVPQDKEFAIYILNNSGKLYHADALAEIYCGKYNPTDKNDVLKEKAIFLKEKLVYEYKLKRVKNLMQSLEKINDRTLNDGLKMREIYFVAFPLLLEKKHVWNDKDTKIRCEFMNDLYAPNVAIDLFRKQINRILTNPKKTSDGSINSISNLLYSASNQDLDENVWNEFLSACKSMLGDEMFEKIKNRLKEKSPARFKDI